jgi:hypothetical protein
VTGQIDFLARGQSAVIGIRRPRAMSADSTVVATPASGRTWGQTRL